jgi:hypothetical protein
MDMTLEIELALTRVLDSKGEGDAYMEQGKSGSAVAMVGKAVVGRMVRSR